MNSIITTKILQAMGPHVKITEKLSLTGLIRFPFHSSRSNIGLVSISAPIEAKRFTFYNSSRLWKR